MTLDICVFLRVLKESARLEVNFIRHWHFLSGPNRVGELKSTYLTCAFSVRAK